MIDYYPGHGLGAIDRPVVAFTLGWQPISVFVWYDSWMYAEGREPQNRFAGLEGLQPLSGRAMVLASGTEPSMSRVGVAPPTLGARDPSPPLAADEPSAISPPPFSGGGARLSAPKGGGVLRSKAKPPVSGSEYDDEIEGKERGWLKS